MSANKKHLNFIYQPGAEFEYKCIFRGMHVGSIEDMMALISDIDFIKELKIFNDTPGNNYISGASKSGVAISGHSDVTKIYAIASFPSVKKKLNILYLRYMEEKE